MIRFLIARELRAATRNKARKRLRVVLVAIAIALYGALVALCNP